MQARTAREPDVTEVVEEVLRATNSDSSSHSSGDSASAPPPSSSSDGASQHALLGNAGVLDAGIIEIVRRILTNK
jgi:hypothetical protein